VDSPEQLEGLQRVGRVVAETIAAVRQAAVPGVTTKQLDVAARSGLRPPRRALRAHPSYGYPGAICLSFDCEVVRGIPGTRRLQAGQLLSIDVAAELGGFHADSATTVASGKSPAVLGH
jgi:methionyl aminopeptidase